MEEVKTHLPESGIEGGVPIESGPNLKSSTKKPTKKVNGELDSLSKEVKKNNLATVSNRARSRSKSPRGKSPDKKDSIKCSDKKDTVSKAAEKKENSLKNSPKKEKSPSKKQKEVNISENQESSPKKKSPKQIGTLANKVKEKFKNAKKAVKRKVKNEANEEASTNPDDSNIDNSEEVGANEPKPKKSKTDDAVSKSKRKCPKKTKKDDPTSKTEPEKNISKGILTNCFNSVAHEEGQADCNHPGIEASKIPNGVLSETETVQLPASSAQNVKKGGNKKVSKHDKALHPIPTNQSAKANVAVGETEDSDTMDYSVNNGNSNFTDNLVEKKVVKIDDIEITELSDLNSSRESGDESDLTRCLVERPQALNDNMTPPKSVAAANLSSSKSSDQDGDKMYACEQEGCKYRGKSKVLLRKHLTHHGIYYCAHCEFLGHNYEEMESHMIANHPQRWGRKKCKKCARYIKRDEFTAHESACEGKKMCCCELCGKEFKYESLLKDHEKKVHGSHNCQFCEFVGDSKQILSHHMSQVHPKKKPDKHKCKHCEGMFQTKKLLSEHFRNVHKTNTALGTHNKPPSLEPHVNSSQDNTTGPPQPFQMESLLQNEPQQGMPNNNEQFDNQFTSIKDFSDTQYSNNTAANLANYQVPNDGSPPHLTFEVKDLNSSEQNDVTQKPTALGSNENSEGSTSTEKSLPNNNPVPPPHDHLADKNKNVERPYACSKCQKRFKDQKSLNGHHNHVHNKELNFKCDVDECQLAFKTARLLQFHKKTVHDVAPGVTMYPCEHPECHLVFKKKGQLKKHEVVHTGERRYICEWPNCGKAFRHNANLKIHNLLHTGEKPIKCNYCDFSCRQKSSLIHHMKTKHKEIEWPPPKGSVPPTPVKKDEPQNQNEESQEEQQNESLDTTKSDADTSFDKSSEMDYSGNNEIHKLENREAPAFPKMLSTPTKAMVKAMAPGFRLNTPGFEKMKPVSPISSNAPPSLVQSKGSADVYDFNDDDNESEVPVLPKKGPPKSPGRPAINTGSSIEALPATEPMNLSADNKSNPDECSTPKKKKYSPKKKKTADLQAECKKKSPKGKQQSLNSSEKLTTIPETDSDSGVKSQESLDHASNESVVEEHVSENPPPVSSPSSSSDSGSVHESDGEDVMEEPSQVAVPSNPEPYPDPPPPTLHPEEQGSNSDNESVGEQYQSVEEPERRPSVEESESDIPQDVQELALHRPVAPSSPSLLAMHLSEKRDTSSHNFGIPHDIDPEETAKLLEESDSFHEKNSSHSVPVIMSNSQSNKEDYLPPSPSSHNNSSIHQEPEQREISGEQFDYNTYGQQQQDYDQIHDLSSHEKEREPETFNDPAQRRPSSSYVPDFLPTMASTSAGSSAMGPPSVSSNYSSPSYSVLAQTQADLPSSFGAPGSNLPHYPPHSSSVPYLSPTSTHAPYPTTTSAGSGITSYPPITSTSYTESDSSDRIPSAVDSRSFRDTETTTVTSSSAYPGSTYSSASRELFGHYLQDPNLPLPHISSQQDPRALSYPGQQSSLQALQRSSADFLQRASATGLPGMNYPSVTESLARLSQTSSQQPWIGHDERSRPWPQPSPIIMPPELDSASPLNRNPFSSTRPEYTTLDSAKRAESVFPTVPSQTVPSATERYDTYMGGPGHFNPSPNYSKTLPPAPTKQLEEAYRHSAASHMTDYRSLSQGPPSVTDMYSRMGMNPALGLDKYYGYSRDAMYRSQHIGSTPNPFMPQTSTAQMPYADRDYAARNPYAQDTAYSKYLPAGNLTQPLAGLQGAPADYFQARPGAPDPYDPYRRSVIHNMMTRYF